MADVLNQHNNIPYRKVDMLDGTWATRFASAIVTPKGLTSALDPTAGGIPIGGSAYGYLRVTDEPTALFSEPFDSLDTTNRWTAKTSTGTAAVTSGVLTCASSSTALAYGGIYTQQTFQAKGLNYMLFGCALKMANSTIADTKRFWGFATLPTTPSVAAPVTDGVGFEVGGDGKLYAVVYEAGTKKQSQEITAKPADGAYGRYLIVRRADTTLFYVNDIYTPKVAFAYAGAGANTVPASFISIAGASPGASATFDVMQFGMGDTGKNASSICDPTNPQFAATVKKASTAVAATDLALAVGIHPTSNTVTAVGTAAHDAAISGNAVRLAGRAVTSNYTAVASGDHADMITTTVGAQVVWPYSIPELSWQYATPSGTPITNTSDVAAKAAAAAGIRNYVTGFYAYNNSATASVIVVKDGSTVMFTGYLPANGSVNVQFETPLRGTAATAVNVALITTATSTYISLQGFTSP